jgi:hypothetical protein
VSDGLSPLPTLAAGADDAGHSSDVEKVLEADFLGAQLHQQCALLRDRAAAIIMESSTAHQESSGAHGCRRARLEGQTEVWEFPDSRRDKEAKRSVCL